MVASAPGSSQDCGVGLDGAAIEGLRRMLLARGIRQLAIDDLRADEVAGLTWAGNIEAIITAARQYPLQGVKADELDKKLRYFEHNAHRMRYAGTATWACSIVAQRAKQSGMHWTVDGAADIIALRCQQASGRWDELWAPPSPGTSTPAALRAAI